jgi:hypothetical protein
MSKITKPVSTLPWEVIERRGSKHTTLILYGAHGEKIAYCVVVKSDPETLELARKDYAAIVSSVNAGSPA